MDDKTIAFMEKLTSRKLWLMLAATILLYNSIIDEETWKWIATAYLGAEAVQQGASSFKTEKVIYKLGENEITHQNVKQPTAANR